MTIKKIISFTILVCFFMYYACNLCNALKQRTTSQMFMKLRANQTQRCRFIDRDFDKLAGSWYYVLRTVTSKNEPEIRCGHLEVNVILLDGFESQLDYLTNNGTKVEVTITGLFVKPTVVRIPELNSLLTGNAGQHPYLVEMGICDNESILFIEPMFYNGGGMIFTRNIPDSVTALKLRFGTFDEQSGKEFTVSVPFNCVVKEEP